MTINWPWLAKAAQPTPEDALGFPAPKKRLRYRAIWVSDVHLGIPESKADAFYDFLKHTESDYLYLVGDIIDCWKLRKGWHWPQLYNNILRTVLGKAKNGTHVTYIPGNHDEVLREYAGTSFGEIDLRLDAIHQALDGRKLLVLHGDEFDSIVKHKRWLANVGAVAYEVVLKVNRWFNAARRKLGFTYWSLSAYLKHKVKNAVQYMDRFESCVAHEASRRHVDGLICGHIHRAAMTKFDDVTYMNGGDWVESCTALVENDDGTFELLNWLEIMESREEVTHAVGNHHGRLVTAS